MNQTPSFQPLFDAYDLLASGCAGATVEDIKAAREKALLLIGDIYDVVTHLGTIQNARARIEQPLDAEQE